MVDSRAWSPHSLHYYHHNLQRWSPHLSLDDLEGKKVVTWHMKREWNIKENVWLLRAHGFLVKCFLLPCSDGLTIPLLAKRDSSAGGRGILQHRERRIHLWCNQDSKPPSTDFSSWKLGHTHTGNGMSLTSHSIELQKAEYLNFVLYDNELIYLDFGLVVGENYAIWHQNIGL